MKWILVCFCMLLPGTLHAQLVIDQQFLPSTLPPSAYIIEDLQTLAQTFTAGQSGILFRIDVEIARRFDPPPFPIFSELRTTRADGSPSDTILGTVRIPTENILTTYSFVSADFYPASIPMISGVRYAIVLRTDSPNTGGGINPYAWRLAATQADDYPLGQNYVNFNNGNGFFASNDEHGFRTIVAIPEPSTVILLSISGIVVLTAVMWVWRRRKEQETHIEGVEAVELQ